MKEIKPPILDLKSNFRGFAISETFSIAENCESVETTQNSVSENFKKFQRLVFLLKNFVFMSKNSY
ncbi:MAG: hypothetical protein K2G83_08170 [Ruminococcus sp.]|nr:hypothetical protein [Ruminococcus sp.]